jgi:hypothetical protein
MDRACKKCLNILFKKPEGTSLLARSICKSNIKTDLKQTGWAVDSTDTKTWAQNQAFVRKGMNRWIS